MHWISLVCFARLLISSNFFVSTIDTLQITSRKRSTEMLVNQITDPITDGISKCISLNFRVVEKVIL